MSWEWVALILGLGAEAVAFAWVLAWSALHTNGEESE